MKTIRSIVLLVLATTSLSFLDRALAQTPSANAGKSWLNSKLAVQLWSFRDDLGKDVPGTLKRVRALGFTRVELAGYYGLTAQQFRAELAKADLQAVAMHIEYETARDRIDEVIREAKLFGVRDVGVPWIKSPFSREDCLAAGEVFNRAGKRLAASGIRFFYHLHGYEFVADLAGKGTLLDLLLTKTDPRYVSLQLDTYHVAFPGQDPVALLRKYRGRFSSLHLKDIRKEVVGDQSGDYREADAVPMGQGKVDWPALLKVARQQGLRWYIIEDETTAVWPAITASLKYLETLKF